MSTMTEKKKGLSAEEFDDLINKAFALTHRIHVIDKDKTRHKIGTAKRQLVDLDAARLREDRDLIVRELKRRCER